MYDVFFWELESLKLDLYSALVELVEGGGVVLLFRGGLGYFGALSEELIFLLDCIIILPHYIKIIR